MKRNWVRWAARIGLAILAVFAAICIALFIWNPEAALLLAAIILQPLLSNTHPAPIAEGHLTTEGWTRVLQQRFPAGTNEAVLKATLRHQGFKPPAPPPEKCWPQGKPAPVGRVIFPCPVHDPSKTLEYRWSDFPCEETMTVWWTTGDNGAIAQISGNYTRACL
jgi:hypothetical protein